MRKLDIIDLVLFPVCFIFYLPFLAYGFIEDFFLKETKPND